MSKPIVLAAAVVGVLSLVFLALNRESPSKPAATSEPDSVAAPAQLEPATRETQAANAQPEAPPPVAAVTPTVPRVPDPSAPKPLNEQAQLAQLQELAASDPPRSLELARAAVAQFPDSPNAPEFEWNVVKALFNMNDLQAAEDEARVMAAKYPDSHFTGDVVHHLLNHPPNPSDVQEPADAETH
jgi:hypothetical protein